MRALPSAFARPSAPPLVMSSSLRRPPLHALLLIPPPERTPNKTTSKPSRRRFNWATGSPTMGALGQDGCAPYTSWYCVTDPFHPGGDPDGDGCRKCAGLLTQCADTGKAPELYKIKSFGARAPSILRPPPRPS